MFRKILTVTVAGAAISLGACATLNQPGVPGANGIIPIINPTGNASIDSAVTQVQSFAIQACGFQPAASTVAGILATFIPGAAPINSIVTQIAQGICAAVTRKGFRRGGPAPTYRGVAIHGTRVR